MKLCDLLRCLVVVALPATVRAKVAQIKACHKPGLHDEKLNGMRQNIFAYLAYRRCSFKAERSFIFTILFKSHSTTLADESR